MISSCSEQSPKLTNRTTATHETPEKLAQGKKESDSSSHCGYNEVDKVEKQACFTVHTAASKSHALSTTFSWASSSRACSSSWEPGGGEILKPLRA